MKAIKTVATSGDLLDPQWVFGRILHTRMKGIAGLPSNYLHDGFARKMSVISEHELEDLG